MAMTDAEHTLKKRYINIDFNVQNAKMALGISDRAYVLETGKIIKTGLAKDLLNDDIVRKAYLGA